MGSTQGQQVQNPRASFSAPQTKAAVNSAEDALLSPKGSPRSPAKPTAWQLQGCSSVADGSQVHWSFTPVLIPRESCGEWDTACQCPCWSADTCCGGKGVLGPVGVPGMLPDQASVLQDPAMVCVPEKTVISKK